MSARVEMGAFQTGFSSGAPDGVGFPFGVDGLFAGSDLFQPPLQHILGACGDVLRAYPVLPARHPGREPAAVRE